MMQIFKKILLLIFLLVANLGWILFFFLAWSWHVAWLNSELGSQVTSFPVQSMSEAAFYRGIVWLTLLVVGWTLFFFFKKRGNRKS